MAPQEKADSAFTVRAKRSRAGDRRRKIEAPQRLVNLSRAAELLGIAYDTVAKAAEDKDLEVAYNVEGAGGRTTPVVTIVALDAYRLRAIARLRGFHSEHHKARAKALEERVLS